MPASSESYRAMAHGEALHDYRSVALRGQSAEDFWSLRYSRIVAAAEDLALQAEEIGGRVFFDATLDDLSSVGTLTDTLIVLAHWKSHVVTAFDFKASVSEVVDVLRSSNDPALLSLCSNAALGEAIAGKDSLAAFLTSVIESGAMLVDESELLRLAGPSKLVAAALSRDLLDIALRTVLCAGNRIELFDGLHTPFHFTRALGEFRGEIDLGTCSSQALATYIFERRPIGLHIIHTRDSVDPLPCYIVTKHALAAWHAVGGTYAAARLEAERALQSLYDD
jgi:hypothetical protein